MTSSGSSRRSEPPIWWRHLFGKPNGFFIELRCHILGHKWWPCDPECCGMWWCERCETNLPDWPLSVRP